MHPEFTPPNEPVPQPLGERSGRPDLPPLPPIAIATEPWRRDLLVVNRVFEVWRIEQAGHLLGRVGEREEHVLEGLPAATVEVVSERPSGGARSSVDLPPGTWGLELSYGTEAGSVEALPLVRRARPAALPASAPVEHLNLLASTEDALKEAGIVTLDDALQAQVDEIMSLPQYPLRAVFDLSEQLVGLIITE
jgi:hypothetical protein